MLFINRMTNMLISFKPQEREVSFPLSFGGGASFPQTSREIFVIYHIIRT